MTVSWDKKYEVWRYRFRGTVDGRFISVSGTAKDARSKKQAEHVEAAAIMEARRPELFAKEKAEEQAAAEAADPRIVTKGNPTIREICEWCIAEYALDDKPRGRRNRNTRLRGSIIPFFGTMRASQLGQSDIEAFVKSCVGPNPSKPRNAIATINAKLVCLSVALQYAKSSKHADGSPRLAVMPAVSLWRTVPKRSRRKMRAYTREQIEALLKATSDQRYRVAILLGSDAGLRVGEIRGLRWPDVDLRAGMLNLEWQIDPDGNQVRLKDEEERSIPITPALRAAIEALPKRSLWLISRLESDTLRLRGIAKRKASGPGGFLSYRTVHDEMVRIADRAKVEHSDKIHVWHSLRHTFGSEAAEHGMPLLRIARLMGHADISTTRMYLSDDEKGDRAAMDLAYAKRTGAANED